MHRTPREAIGFGLDAKVELKFVIW